MGTDIGVGVGVEVGAIVLRVGPTFFKPITDFDYPPGWFEANATLASYKQSPASLLTDGATISDGYKGTKSNKRSPTPTPTPPPTSTPRMHDASGTFDDTECSEVTRVFVVRPIQNHSETRGETPMSNG